MNYKIIQLFIVGYKLSFFQLVSCSTNIYFFRFELDLSPYVASSLPEVF